MGGWTDGWLGGFVFAFAVIDVVWAAQGGSELQEEKGA